jgi:hypothetical protein
LSSIGLTIVVGNGVLEYLIFLKRMILNTVKALTKFTLQVLNNFKHETHNRTGIYKYTPKTLGCFF